MGLGLSWWWWGFSAAVECAFGRLKGRFMILENSGLSDPRFDGDVFMVCGALHNYIERAKQPAPATTSHTPTTNPSMAGNPNSDVQGAAGIMRSHLANHAARVHNIRPVTYDLTTFRAVRHGPVGVGERRED